MVLTDHLSDEFELSQQLLPLYRLMHQCFESHYKHYLWKGQGTTDDNEKTAAALMEIHALESTSDSDNKVYAMHMYRHYRG